MDEFQYQSLVDDEIRLLSLQPSSAGEQLHVLIQHTPLSTAKGQYEALSYTWGDATVLHALQCSNDKSYLQITTNLRDALWDLRLETQSRLLWVDAACIYSHRTATKYLGTMRFAPQVFEGFNFTHLVSQIW
jgi:hypothetical protein